MVVLVHLLYELIVVRFIQIAVAVVCRVQDLPRLAKNEDGLKNIARIRLLNHIHLVYEEAF